MDLDKGEPPFDVMIIDECSKTTFQEFLVPARFAKRWILVGDVRQFSPFTDREQIVANLDNLMISPGNKNKAAKTLSSSVQRACYLLEELRGNKSNPYQQPMLVPVNSSVLIALANEVAARQKDNSLSKGFEAISFIQNKSVNQPVTPNVFYFERVIQEPWHLYIHNLYFIDEACIEHIQSILPNDMVILDPNWQRTAHAFTHKGSSLDNVKNFEVKTTTFSNTQ